MVCIRLNGETRHLEAPSTVAQLVAELALPRDSIAVEVNRSIVPRSTYESTTLAEDDLVEIVTMMGGG